MRYSFTVILFFCFLLCTGQDFTSIVRIESMDVYTHKGYTLLDSASGNLNRDNYKDLLVVYKKIDEKEISDVIDNPADRPLLIYLGDKEGNLKLTARNDKVVLCYDCGGVWGDPYEAMVIKNGYFTLEHYGGSSWRWTRFITFKYSEKDQKWYLHKDGGDSYHTSEPDSIKTEIQTVKDFGIVEFEKFEY